MNTLTEKINKQIAAYRLKIECTDASIEDAVALIRQDRTDIIAQMERARLNGVRQSFVQMIAELQELLLLAE